MNIYRFCLHLENLLWLLAQDQASEHLIVEWEGIINPPPLAKEPLTTDDFWGRESGFLLRCGPGKLTTI